MAANGNLIFQDTNKATFVGANSNVVIDTVHASFGVGVDVNGPTSNLHVVGNCFVSTDFTASTLSGNGSGLTALNAANVTTGTLAVTRGGTGTTTSTGTGGVVLSDAPTFTGDVTFDTNTLFVDSVNDRVGVGTTSPDNALHIRGAIPAVLLDDSDDDTKVRITGGAGGDLYVDSNWGGSGNTGDIIFREASSEKMRITGAGNVGIGTTSPGGKLDIRGSVSDPSIPTVHIGDNAADFGDYGMVNLVRNPTESGTKAHLAFIRSGNTIFSQGYYNNTNTFGFWPSFGSVANTPAMAFATNGNVGIGDSDPDSILHVQSDVQSGTGGPIKKTSATAATSGYNYFLNAPRPGTTDHGAVFFINGSTRTNDGDTNTLTIRNDSGSVDIGRRSETLVDSHTPAPETYNANQKNVDILLNNGSIWMSPYTGRHRNLGTSTNTWSQYIGKHYLGRILSGLEIENKNTNSAGATGYYSNLLHFRAHDYAIYENRTMTLRGDKVGIRTETPGHTLEVNGSLFYSSGGLNGSDDRIKYNEENITNALDIIDKLTPQKYEKIMTFPSNAKGTWIPTDENWETVKNAEMKPWEGFKYGNEFGFIAQDVRNIPEVSFLVSGSESITGDENISPEEYNELNDEERSSYTQKFIYESNVITLQEYTSLTLENRENYTELYSKRVETQTPLGLNYQGIFVVAVKAIQELKSENETLKTQLATVLARLDALESA